MMTKLRSIPIDVKAGIAFAVCGILQKGISMITIPIFTRILSLEEYGVVSIYQSWYQIISVIATLNLASGVFNNGMIKFDKDEDCFISSMQGLSTTSTLLIVGIYPLLHAYWNNLIGLHPILIFVMSIELLFSPAFSFWSAKQRFKYKYKLLIMLTLFAAVIGPILGVISVTISSHKAEARIISYAIAQVIVPVILYLMQFYKGKKFFHANYWKYALAFNLPLIPHYLSTIILAQSDRIMIGRLSGSQYAAIYGVASSVALLINIFTSSLNNAFIPFSYSALKGYKVERIKSRANGLILMVGVIASGIIAFGPEVVRIFATDEYYAAIWVIPPLL